MTRPPGPSVACVALAALTACAPDLARELSEPVTLASEGASNPTVAVDPASGDAYVAWVGSRGGVSDVLLARWPTGGPPEEPVRVNDVPGDAAPHLQAPAQVAAGVGGPVYVLWQNNTRVEGREYPASDLRFARSLDGGRTFEPALTVNDDPPGSPPASHTFHDMVVGPRGEVIVSWIDSREPEGVAEPDGLAAAHGGMGGHGHHGSGMGGSGPGPEIRVSVSTDGGRTFGTSHVVDGNACPCCRTELAVGPAGEILVAWRKVFDGSVRDVVVARSLDGGASWQAPVRVHGDDWVFDGCPHAGPAMAVDASGALHVAWYTGKDGAPGLYYARSEDGGVSFTAASTLAAEGWVPPSQVALLATGGGLWAAWELRTEGPPELLITRTLAGEVPATRGALRFAGSNPALGAGGGRHVIAWLDGEAVRAAVGGG